MDWCDNCKKAVRPIEYSNTPTYDDRRRTICRCPSCNAETEEADRCACGEYKRREEDWCEDCIAEVKDGLRPLIENLTGRGLSVDEAEYLITDYAFYHNTYNI